MFHEVSTKPSQSSRRWNRRDSIPVAILALVNLALRLPFLSVPLLSRDEAEYMAKGAFTQATGQTAFMFHGTSYTAEAFKISAELFGKYNPVPLRSVIAVIAFVVAVSIYRWLARDTSRMLALASAILFSAWSFAFQSANILREWPCLLAITTGAHLFMLAQRRTGGRGSWLVFAAGLATSFALFFKEQSFYMTLAAPLWLAYKAAETRSWRPWLGQGLLFLGGGLLGGAIYITPFLIDGRLLTHIQGELRFGSIYTSESSAGRMPLLTQYLWMFTSWRPVRLFLPAWIWFFAQGARALWRLRKGGQHRDDRHRGCRRQGDARRDRELLAILYFGTAIAVVQMGRNFFPYYFMFWAPFAFIAEGYAIDTAVRLRANRPAGGVIAAIIVCAALATIRFEPPVPLALPAAGATAIAAVVALTCIRRPIASRRLIAAISIMMVLLAVVSAGPQVRRSAAPEADGDLKAPSLEARKFFASHSNPSTDRMFVWGWEPGFYVHSKLVPANKYVVCSGMFNRFWFPTDLVESAAEPVVTELRANPPRFIVTAPPDEKTLFPMCALHKFPSLEKWMRGKYHRVAELPDCEVYERNSSPAATPH